MNPDERSAVVEATMRPEIERLIEEVSSDARLHFPENIERMTQAIADLEAVMLPEGYVAVPSDDVERIIRHWYPATVLQDWSPSVDGKLIDRLVAAKSLASPQYPASNRAEVCPECGGREGAGKEHLVIHCPECGGTGIETIDTDGSGTFNIECSGPCQGTVRVSASGEPGGSEGE